MLNGVSLSEYPDLVDVQQCDREGIYKDFFSWHSTIVARVAERLGQCQINATAGLDEPDKPSLPAPLTNAVLSSDAGTAEQLLAAGANPFVLISGLADTPTTALHIAARHGSDRMIELLLAAAHAKSPQSLRELVMTKDVHGRPPADAAFSDKAICLLQAAARGLAPADAGCPAAASVWPMKTEDSSYAPDARDAQSCQAGSTGCAAASTAVFGNADGWQRYESSTPPLARDIGSHHCGIPEIKGAIGSEAFMLQYRSLRKPVMFRGAAAKWPAMTKWTKHYVAAAAGDVEVECSSIP